MICRKAPNIVHKSLQHNSCFIIIRTISTVQRQKTKSKEKSDLSLYSVYFNLIIPLIDSKSDYLEFEQKSLTYKLIQLTLNAYFMQHFKETLKKSSHLYWSENLKKSSKRRKFLPYYFRHSTLPFISIFIILSATPSYANNMLGINSVNNVMQDGKIIGVITDLDGNFLPGVSIVIEGTNIGVVSDIDGNFTIAARVGDVLKFSFIGMKTQLKKITDNKRLKIIMEEENKALDEVVVVGFGTQKKESVVSSITTVKVKDIKGPTSNLTTMLSGRIAGIISYQTSGEPGQDNAKFFVRGVGSFGAGKVDPLILIDGIESSNNDLARLQPDDIESFSVLKDATASAVYGSRGANGVILVNTKSGKESKTKFNFRVENSISTNTRNFKFTDNITYMELANEAALTRDPLATLPYTQNKIDHTRNGDNPLLYPNNNWIDQLIKDNTMNQRYNMNVSGGGKVAQYYIAGTLNIDNGILKSGASKQFDNNSKLRNYSIRSNTNLHVTSTTEAIIRVYGQFDDQNGPIGGGSSVFNSAIWSNPVMFPATYPKSMSPYANHELFGNALIPNSTTLYENPYAKMVSGYSAKKTSRINAQFELRQDLKFITDGLKIRAMGYVERYSEFEVSRNFNPFFYKANTDEYGNISLLPYNDGGSNSIGNVGTEYLSYNEGGKIVNSKMYAEIVATYDRVFRETHSVNALLIGRISDYSTGNAGNLQASLPSRNVGLSGRAAYNYGSRYFAEFNFGLNASERFHKNNRWGFFPSIGLAWNIANEKFWEPLKNKIESLKIRGSYGLVGNDQIGNENDRFFYLSNVNLSDEGYGYTFGELYSYHRPGVSINRYANEKIGWETSKQANIAVDISGMGFNLTAEYFTQYRSNILMDRSYIPNTMGLTAAVKANVGEVSNHGMDLSLEYNKAFTNSMWIQSRFNFTYAHNELKVFDEPSYPSNEYYRTRVGLPYNTTYGLIAERLFVDDADVANSPNQTFGKYGAGDIKYRDMNGDGQITEADAVPIGLPTEPEISYGFGASLGWKDFDFSFFFQGLGRRSFQISSSNLSPFVINGGNQNGLLEVIADDHWSEDNRNIYAFWPRLSPVQVANNNQTSTWWLRDGAFLRLKNIELGYNIPTKILSKWNMSNLRLYFNASNLFVWSKFKMWDPEMGSNGIGYPVQRVFNIGLTIGI